MKPVAVQAGWGPLRREAGELAARLPPLLVEAERIAATVAQGVHGRRRVGSGESFWQFRRYSAGDHVAKIDWRRSAKSSHLFVRETEWEAAQSVWLWRDTSASMDYTSLAISKRQRASVLALALSILLVQGGERIASLGEHGSAQSGRSPINRLAYLYSTQASGVESLPPVLPLPRHAQTVWLSDFFSDARAIAERIKTYCAAGVKGHLLQILDPSEAEYGFRGRVRFEGVEDDLRLLAGRAEQLREDYQRRLAAHQDVLGEQTRRLGWTFAVHRIDHPPQSALLALYAAMGAQA